MYIKKEIDKRLNKDTDLKVQPVIVRVGDFDEAAPEKFAKSFNDTCNSGQSVIPVIIDSYGGQVYALMAMISTIKNSPLPVATIIQGKAMSCGAILASFGADGMRYCDPDATVMIHDVASGSYGKVEEVKASSAETDRLNNIVYKTMAQNCGKKDDYFMKLADEKKHADWYLNAAEAKKHGIINHIRMPSFSVKISAEIDFE
jgi:ATP-dependent Clp protease, protease subunit